MPLIEFAPLIAFEVLEYSLFLVKQYIFEEEIWYGQTMKSHWGQEPCVACGLVLVCGGLRATVEPFTSDWKNQNLWIHICPIFFSDLHANLYDWWEGGGDKETKVCVLCGIKLQLTNLLSVLQLTNLLSVWGNLVGTHRP